MSIEAVTISDALKSFGPGRIFTGDAFTAGGLAPLGATEGGIRLATPYDLNMLTANEFSGQVPHEATVTPGLISVTAPIIFGDESAWEKVSPTGSKGMGWNSPQNVVKRNLLLVPLNEMLTNVDPPTLGYDGVTWSPKAPVNAIWLWAAVPSIEEVPYAYEDGGKSIVDVTFTGFFFAQNPSGQKVYTVGNPVAQGITTIRL